VDREGIYLDSCSVVSQGGLALSFSLSLGLHSLGAQMEAAEAELQVERTTGEHEVWTLET
jgi:hypothetical protein